ncbi:MAG: polyphosphate polymerase domain-containing protein [Clostridia bacterium]|nr:polyphosphate polymerase domain-containing protein [Clostridia bacterium]
MDKYRHEYKYLIDPGQRSILLMKAAPLMQPDPHTGEDGSYLIRSLYFDDSADTCFFQNESGCDPRAKFRIRYYGDDTSFIRLEKKSKRRGMTLKRSCGLTEEEAANLAAGRFPEITSDMPEEKRRLLCEMVAHSLLPKVIVTYQRIPFLYPAGNVRITFDGTITASDETKKFLTRDYRQFPALPAGKSILEVKWDELLPLHIKQIMQLDTLQWSAFSKYYTCRRIVR